MNVTALVITLVVFGAWAMGGAQQAYGWPRWTGGAIGPICGVVYWLLAR